MAHRHSIQGLVTGPAVIDSNNTNLHWHAIAGEKTTTNTFIKGHIHHWRGIRTSTSIIMPGAEDETNQ